MNILPLLSSLVLASTSLAVAESTPAKPVTLVVAFKVAEGKSEPLKAAARDLIKATRAEAGCINYYLYQSDTDARSFVFYENWASAEALEAHSKSKHIMSYRAATKGFVIERKLEKMTEVK